MAREAELPGAGQLQVRVAELLLVIVRARGDGGTAPRALVGGAGFRRVWSGPAGRPRVQGPEGLAAAVGVEEAHPGADTNHNAMGPTYEMWDAAASRTIAVWTWPL